MMTLSYDDSADVLYITFGDSGSLPCEYAEHDEGIIVRFDPASGRVFGCTITAFKIRLGNWQDISIPEVGILPAALLASGVRASRGH